MKFVLALLLAASVVSVAPSEASAWISGCSAWKHSNNQAGYSAVCTSGNARYVAKATCFGVGGYRTDYGSWVWPGGRSDGYCPPGYYVTKVGCTQ